MIFIFLYLWIFTNDETVQKLHLTYFFFHAAAADYFDEGLTPGTHYYTTIYPKKKKEFVLDIAASSVFVLLGIGDMKDISDSLEALNKSQSKQGEGFGGFWVF